MASPVVGKLATSSDTGNIRGWFSRIRSISTPIGGVAWDPPPKDAEPSTSGAATRSSASEPEDAHLSEEEDEILSALGTADDQCLELDEIVRAVSLTEVRARHHLDVLEEHRLVSHTEDPMYGYIYSLTSKGRRYVVEQDLVE